MRWVLKLSTPSIERIMRFNSNTSIAAPIKRYSRKLKVGDDYMMFVALGDFKTGYTFNTGNIETVQSINILPSKNLHPS